MELQLQSIHPHHHPLTTYSVPATEFPWLLQFAISLLLSARSKVAEHHLQPEVYRPQSDCSPAVLHLDSIPEAQ